MEERIPPPLLPPPPPPPPPHRDDHRHPLDTATAPKWCKSPRTKSTECPRPSMTPSSNTTAPAQWPASAAPAPPASAAPCALPSSSSFLGAFLYLVVQPCLPQFSITNVSIGHPAWPSSQRRPSNPKYEFTMKADNGNPVMSVQYYRGGSASLIHKGQGIASGQISHFDQNAAESTPFRLTFTGKDSLPLELQKKDATVKLVLSSDLPMKMKIGVLSLPGMDLYVVCEVKMKKTSKGMQISSQSCKNRRDQ